MSTTLTFRTNHPGSYFAQDETHRYDATKGHDGWVLSIRDLPGPGESHVVTRTPLIEDVHPLKRDCLAVARAFSELNETLATTARYAKAVERAYGTTESVPQPVDEPGLVADVADAWDSAWVEDARRLARNDYADAELDELEIATQSLAESVEDKDLPRYQRTAFEARYAVVRGLRDAARAKEAQRLAEEKGVDLRATLFALKGEAVRLAASIERHQAEGYYWLTKHSGKLGKKLAAKEYSFAEDLQGVVTANQAKIDAIEAELARRD